MKVPTSWQLQGRVCLITGATSGIGRAAALLLARLGAELVLVGRDSRRISHIVEEVKRTAPQSQVVGMVADLSSQSEVRRLAQRVLAEVPRLHVLINNAAVVTLKREETVDGLERQFAVNHLAPFLLTNLLLPRLVESAPSRVVVVASQVERGGSIDFNDLQRRAGEYNGNRAYSQTKFANVLFTRELAARVGALGVTPISLHPGVYATRLLDKLMGWSHLVTRLRGRGPVGGPEGGAFVLARAAAAPELAGRAGVHLHEHEIAEPSERARDTEVGRRLWTESVRLTGLDAAVPGG